MCAATTPTRSSAGRGQTKTKSRVQTDRCVKKLLAWGGHIECNLKGGRGVQPQVFLCFLGAVTQLERQALDLQAECKQLMGKFRTLILATSDATGAPDASTVPYVLSDGGFAILVSELAKHTSHLLETRRCTVLFLEDERETANVFARKRFTIGCRVLELDRSEPQSELLLDRMAAKFGPVTAMLRQLPDFHLLRLEPFSCNYVRGFGQAFLFEPKDHSGIWSESAAVGNGGVRKDDGGH